VILVRQFEIRRIIQAFSVSSQRGALFLYRGTCRQAGITDEAIAGYGKDRAALAFARAEELMHAHVTISSQLAADLLSIRDLQEA
jgi:hypothetical protein